MTIFALTFKIWEINRAFGLLATLLSIIALRSFDPSNFWTNYYWSKIPK